MVMTELGAFSRGLMIAQKCCHVLLYIRRPLQSMAIKELHAVAVCLTYEQSRQLIALPSAMHEMLKQS